jgi:peptidoglycan/xylan/chitin deacetylase (PgdA/CDA1 family)
MDYLLRVARPIGTPPKGSLTPGENYVAVTFDDGFVSVLEQALPELRRRGIPCTVFVPSGCLGQRAAWLRNAPKSTRLDRVVTPDELRALASDPLVTIGSHSVSHANFARLDKEAAAIEFALSKENLESLLGKPVRSLSFPFGAHNPALVQQARQLGYQRLFTSEPVIAFQSPYEVLTGRVGVEPSDWSLEFRLMVTGAYRWRSALTGGKRWLRSWLRPRAARPADNVVQRAEAQTPYPQR